MWVNQYHDRLLSSALLLVLSAEYLDNCHIDSYLTYRKHEEDVRVAAPFLSRYHQLTTQDIDMISNSNP